MTQKQAIPLAGKLAKALNAQVTTEKPDNSYGGYKDGEKKLWVKEDGTVKLVLTCGNCGEGQFQDVTKLLKAFKPSIK